MIGTDMLLLTIVLTDGRILSGTYPYLVALARQEAALAQPNCLSAVVHEVK